MNRSRVGGTFDFQKKVCQLGATLEISTRPCCHERAVRLRGAQARATGKVARQTSEIEQALFLHRGGCHRARGRSDSRGHPLGGEGHLSAGLISAILGGVVVVSAAVGKLFKFHENWLHYRALVEAVAREKELYSAGAGDYAAIDATERDRLLVERVENLLANKTAQFLDTHKRTGENDTSD